MTIKAVLFDMGNTLIKYDVETEAEVFHRILLSSGISKPLEEIKTAIMKAKHEAKALDMLSLFGKLQCREYWYRWNSLVLKHLNIDNDDVAKNTQARWFDNLECSIFPEVKSVLVKLKQMGLKIGLMTNTYEEEIPLILGKANLEMDIFDIIVGADTVKKVKPYPDVFEYAINKLSVRPEEAMFVGDDVEADYKGAENAGLHPLLIDRAEKQKQSGLRTIKNLKEILSQID